MEVNLAENGQDHKEYAFNSEEMEEVNKHVAKYPDPKSAVMPVLWIAQRKYRWLSNGALQLVADTLNLSYAHVYGVASFYTMYHKKDMGRFVIDVCTCFTCGELEGDEILQHAKKYADCDENGISKDGNFCFRHAECLGACDSGPMCQVANGPYVHKLDKQKMESLIDDLKAGKMPAFASIPLSDQTQI